MSYFLGLERDIFERYREVPQSIKIILSVNTCEVGVARPGAGLSIIVNMRDGVAFSQACSAPHFYANPCTTHPWTTVYTYMLRS